MDNTSCNCKYNILLPRTSEEIDELSDALVKAQAEFPTIGKNKKGGGGRYNYADLTEVAETIKPIMDKYKLCWLQPPAVVIDTHRLIIATKIKHSSGQWMESYYPVPDTKQEELRGGLTTIQGQGSNLSYCKRYALTSMLGIVTADEDTDGQPVLRSSQNAGEYTPSNNGLISEKQANLLKYKLRGNAALQQKIIAHYQVSSLDNIPRSQFDAILQKIENQ